MTRAEKLSLRNTQCHEMLLTHIVLSDGRGCYTSRLSVDCVPRALSCLPSARRWWSLHSLSFSASIQACAKKKREWEKEKKHIFPHGARSARQQCGKPLNTEVRGEKLILYVYGSQKKQGFHCRPYHNNLKWISHNSLAPDGCNLLRAHRLGRVLNGLVAGAGALALRSSNWLRAVEWFGPTAPSDRSSSWLIHCLPGEFVFQFVSSICLISQQANLDEVDCHTLGRNDNNNNSDRWVMFTPEGRDLSASLWVHI